MKCYDFYDVDIKSGFWFEKEKLNRETTIISVYEQFEKSGRIRAFDFETYDKSGIKPHYFWDSDVAKWIESAAYVLAKHHNSSLEGKIDSLIEKIKLHQGEDGYFNIYFTVVKPEERFKNRDCHELYCAGHLIEAAIACDKIGKHDLLECMDKYIDYIHRVFVVKKSAAFTTPGHEEIELALLRLYRHKRDEKYLKLAQFFINERGTENDTDRNMYNQSHIPVRRQEEAVGHSVRALYLYTGMAMLAKETDDAQLLDVCRKLFENIASKKMYITGGIGSTHIGETFTNAYDLPNDTAYAETCAGIAMMFFCRAMLENENRSEYADIIEREFYNGVLSGLSADGKRFFYENALEINLNEHFDYGWGKPRFPITRRPEIFDCSCCPPNINRLLASLGNYVYGFENDTLYINQYVPSTLKDGERTCEIATYYPKSGIVKIKAHGVKKVAFRIPEYSLQNFSISAPYTLNNGYAIITNTGECIELSLDVSPRAVYSNSLVTRDAHKMCIMAGPVVYCAEALDNKAPVHTYAIPQNFGYSADTDKISDKSFFEFDIHAYALQGIDELYTSKPPRYEKAELHIIPYCTFANREECDMRVWFDIPPITNSW